MASRWQNYVNKRLGELIKQANNPKARKKAFQFMNRHWRRLPNIDRELKADFTSFVNDGMRQHSTELVKYAPKIVSKPPSVLTLDQRYCKTVADSQILWNKLDPNNRWWAVFKWLPFVANIITRLKQDLIIKSPLFKAKFEEKSLFNIANEDMAYFNEFLRDGSHENEVLFEELTKDLALEQLQEINSTDKWDDRVKQYIQDKNLLKISQEEPASSSEVKEDVAEKQKLEKELRIQQEEQKRLDEELRRQAEAEQKRLDEELRRQAEAEQTQLEQEEKPLQEAEQTQQLEQEEKCRQAEEEKKQLEEEEKRLEKIAGKQEAEEKQEPEFFNYEKHPLKEKFERDETETLATYAKKTSFERNNDPHSQFKRDIVMVEEMLKSPGGDEYKGKLSARILKKLMYVMAHADPMYKRGGKWYRFSKPHDVEKQVPVASILTHTTRMTIELPPIDEEDNDLGRDFFREFLWEGNPNKREAATHGGVFRAQPEETCDGIPKNVDEIKPGLAEAAWKAIKKKTLETLGYELSEEGHYGSNCTFGGAGNKNYFSGRIINDKGENGHIYMYYRPATKDKPGFIIIGIEQAAPSDCAAPEVVYFPHSVFDNYGGGHTPYATPSHSSVTGNDHFGKPPKYQKDNKDYEGIQEFGTDEYYNSMYLHLNREQLRWIFDKYNDASFSNIRIDRPPIGTISDLGDYQKEQEQIKVTEQPPANGPQFFKPVGKKLSEEDLTALVNEFEMIEPSGEASTKQVISQAQNALKVYLKKEGINEDDKNKMQYFIDELSNLSNIIHLTEIINQMESVSIHIKDSPEKSIRDLILEKGGSCLSDDIRKGLKMDLVDEGNNVHGTILGSGSLLQDIMQMFYTGSDVHFKDQLIEAHGYLMKLIPEHINAIEHAERSSRIF